MSLEQQGAKTLFRHNKAGFYAIAVLFAVAIQVQLTLFKSEDYLGLRINVADFLLPFAGLGILASLLLKKSKWPDWRLRHMYIWLAALTAVLGLAFVNGYYLTGEFSQWALVNKLIGWFVLMAYFGLGGWFSANGGEKFHVVFLQAFIWFFLAIFIFDVGRGLYDIFGPGLPGIDFFQLSGLVGNRNAYALLFLCGLALVAIFQFERQQLWPAFIAPVLWGLLFLAAILNGSRAGWGCGLLLLFYLGARYKLDFFKKAGVSFIIGALVTIIAFHYAGGSLSREGQTSRFASLYDYSKTGELYEGVHTSEEVRFRGFADGTQFWKQKPLIGIGLGSFLSLSDEKYDSDPDVIIDIIHSTPIWLLVETGLIGLSLFTVFFCLILWCLWRDGCCNKTFNGRFLWSLFLMLIIFGLLSQVHELLYTRFLWLFLGLGMGRIANKDVAGG